MDGITPQILVVSGLCSVLACNLSWVAGNSVFGESAGGGVFNSVAVFGGTSGTSPATDHLGCLLGVAAVSNVTVPSWQSFDEMTGFLVILTELAIGIGAGLILTIWFSSALCR